MDQLQSAAQAANELERDEGVRYWRASGYIPVQDHDGRRWVQAAHHAKWTRFSPFNRYGQADAAPRRSPRGAHTEFLTMKAALLERTDIHSADHEVEEMTGFANRFGLLGLYYEWYSAPILPAGKSFVLPDAAMSTSGKLRRFDNRAEDVRETEAFPVMQRGMRRYLGFSDDLNPAAAARPSELKFALKRNRLAEKPNPAGFEPYSELSAWAEVKERFGALMLLDFTSGPWARLLITRELADAWLFALPAYSEPPAQLSSSEKKALAWTLRADLRGVSPYPSLGKDGEWKPGWMCSSLLQAICLMLYYDLTGGVDIRRCALPGCGKYFRTPEGSRRMYCPPEEANNASKCASAATSRAYRERKAQL